MTPIGMELRRATHRDNSYWDGAAELRRTTHTAWRWEGGISIGRRRRRHVATSRKSITGGGWGEGGWQRRRAAAAGSSRCRVEANSFVGSARVAHLPSVRLSMPFTASWIVPSPPTTTKPSYPTVSTVAAKSRAWPAYSVSIAPHHHHPSAKHGRHSGMQVCTQAGSKRCRRPCVTMEGDSNPCVLEDRQHPDRQVNLLRGSGLGVHHLTHSGHSAQL